MKILSFGQYLCYIDFRAVFFSCVLFNFSNFLVSTSIKNMILSRSLIPCRPTQKQQVFSLFFKPLKICPPHNLGLESKLISLVKSILHPISYINTELSYNCPNFIVATSHPSCEPFSICIFTDFGSKCSQTILLLSSEKNSGSYPAKRRSFYKIKGVYQNAVFSYIITTFHLTNLSSFPSHLFCRW